MSKFRFAIGMLVAGGGLGAAAEANAATQVYDYSAFTPAQNVDILGQTEYTYGADSSDPKSYLSPAASTAQIGSFGSTPTSPATDHYSHTNTVKTEGFLGPNSDLTYANLKFEIGATTYDGAANFVFDNKTGDVVLHSIDYAAVPEPSEWALLVAGLGLAGAALRRRRHASAIA